MSDSIRSNNKNKTLPQSITTTILFTFLGLCVLLYVKVQDKNRKDCITEIKNGNFPSQDGTIYLRPGNGSMECKDFIFLNEIKELQK